MKTEIGIPKSAASGNLCIFLVMAGLTSILWSLSLPLWIVIIVGGCALGFLLATIYCVLDIQEFKMKQNQRIIELLEKKNA